MKTYQFDPEKLKKQTKILALMYSIPLVLMVVLVFFLYRDRPEMQNQAIIMVVLMVVFYGFMGFRRHKQNVQLWKEYSLTVDDEGVSQTQPNFPKVRVPKEEVKSIEVVKNGFYVQTYSQGRVLGISKELADADYEELKQIFSKWAAENEANRPAELEEDDDVAEIEDEAVVEGTEETEANEPEFVETAEELEDLAESSTEEEEEEEEESADKN